MKKILSIAVICLLSFKTAPSDDLKYEDIVEAPNHTKAEIYAACKLAMITMFKDAKQVIQDENREDGSIIGKGYYTVSHSDHGRKIPKDATTEYTVWFIIKLSVKDGKYRVQMSDLSIAQRTIFLSASAGSPIVLDPGVSGPVDGIKACADGYGNIGDGEWAQRIRATCKWFSDSFDGFNKEHLAAFETEINKNLAEKKDNW